MHVRANENRLASESETDAAVGLVQRQVLGKRPISDPVFGELEKGLQHRHQVELDDLGEVLKPVFFRYPSSG
jgi:hypothetical protein